MCFLARRCIIAIISLCFLLMCFGISHINLKADHITSLLQLVHCPQMSKQSLSCSTLIESKLHRLLNFYHVVMLLIHPLLLSPLLKQRRFTHTLNHSKTGLPRDTVSDPESWPLGLGPVNVLQAGMILCSTWEIHFSPLRLRPLAMPRGARTVSVCEEAVGIPAEVGDRKVWGEQSRRWIWVFPSCPLHHPAVPNSLPVVSN